MRPATRAIILAAGVGARMGALTRDKPKALLEVAGEPIALHQARLHQKAGCEVMIAAGHGIAHVEALGLPVAENAEYTTTNMVWSLEKALRDWTGPVVISYGDIIFGEGVLDALLDDPAADAVVVDELWRGYWQRRLDDPLSDAESLRLNAEGNIVDIGRKNPAPEDVQAQYTGLFKLSAATVERIRAMIASDPSRYRTAYMTDLLRDLIGNGVALKAVRVRRGWYEFDAASDLKLFEEDVGRQGLARTLEQEPPTRFLTKAENLAEVAGRTGTATVPPFTHFTVQAWRERPQECLKEVAAVLGDARVIVRSSAAAEDAGAQSNAGAFLSVPHVDPRDATALSDAIDRVAASYSDQADDERDRVLIQHMVKDVVMSGVALTRDLAGGPYHVINYDESSSTDRVTAGHEHRTVYVAHSSDGLPGDLALDAVVGVAKELVAITGHDALDIEFARDVRGAMHLLQVRPIASARPADRSYDAAIARELEDIRAFLTDRLARSPTAHGRTTLLGVMPDWNPAEIVGTRPRPLALSLYRYIITDSVWRQARADIGYFEPFPERLMVALGGCPYIDVRASFNSFLPAGLRIDLREQVVDHYLAHLGANHELHDKVEFEVAITCLDLDFPRHAERLRAAGFDNGEIGELRQGLLFLTDEVVRNGEAHLRTQLDLVRRMDPRRAAILRQAGTLAGIPRQVSALLDDCIRHGTLPFATLARYAFIGAALLRSLSSRGLLQPAQSDALLTRVRTVTSAMVEDHVAMADGRLSREEFLVRYGHLRPGTYNILSPRYDERPDLYFGEVHRELAAAVTPEFAISVEQEQAIDEHLAAAGFTFTSATLFDFVARSLEARELAKFEFTRNLSAALRLIQQFGELIGSSVDDMSFVPIREFLELDAESAPRDLHAHFARLAHDARERFEIARRLQLPPLVTEPKDILVVHVPQSRPNFITQKRVLAPALRIAGAMVERPAVDGKIILIEHADPGYDWLFTRGIAGLVTKYGGVASHMAIRCAELGIPAAVGCGDALFDRLADARAVELDAAGRHVSRVD